MAAAGSRAQRLDREPRVLSAREALRPRLHELPDERPVLVQRRAPGAFVLLEGERQLGAVAEVAVEDGEGAQTEGAQRVVEVRRADAHGGAYDPGAPGPPSGSLGAGTRGGSGPAWQLGHQ